MAILKSGRFCWMVGLMAGIMTANGYAVTPPEEVWNKVYDSGGDDQALGIAVDGAGNVYVCGRCDPPTTHDYRTIKYDPDGNIVWNNFYDSGTEDEAYGIAVDGSGNVIVTGRSGAYPTYDFRTIKYLPDGTEKWNKVYDSGGDDEATGIAVDGAGNVYVTGCSVSGTNADFRFIKYDPDGNILLNIVHDAASYDLPLGIAVDGAGYIYVTGLSGSLPSDLHCLTIKYDRDGNIVWAKTFNSGATDVGHGVAVDSAGNVYVTGYSGSTSHTDFRTIKYLPDGTEKWNQVFSYPTLSSGADGVAVDGAGYVYVTGNCGSGSNYDMATMKYDPEGNIVWNKVYDSGTDDGTEGVAVDGAGYVYLTGSSGSSGAYDFRTIKYRQFFTISGKVGMNNVEVKLSGASSGSFTTDASGTYKFADLACGKDYTVTPYKPGYTFTPPALSFTPLGRDQQNQDFNPTGIDEMPAASNFRFSLEPVSGTSARLRYGLATSCRVVISMYDVSGKKVAVLVDGEKPAGTYVCSWTPGVAGVYFARMTAGSYRAGRKFIVVR